MKRLATKKTTEKGFRNITFDGIGTGWAVKKVGKEWLLFDYENSNNPIASFKTMGAAVGYSGPAEW